MKIGSRIAQYARDGKLDLDEQAKLRAEAKALTKEGRTAEAKVIDAMLTDAPQGLSRLAARFEHCGNLDAHKALAQSAAEGLGWSERPSETSVRALVERWAAEPPAMGEALIALATLSPGDRAEAFTALAATVAPEDVEVLLAAMGAAPADTLGGATHALLANPKLRAGETIDRLAAMMGGEAGVSRFLGELLDSHGGDPAVRVGVHHHLSDAAPGDREALERRAVDLAGGSLTELVTSTTRAQGYGHTWDPPTAQLITARVGVVKDRAEADALAAAVTRLPGEYPARAPLLEALAKTASPAALTLAIYDAAWSDWDGLNGETKVTRYAPEQLELVMRQVLPRASPDEKVRVLAVVREHLNWESVGPKFVKLLIEDRSLPRGEVQRLISDYAAPHWGSTAELQQLLDAAWPK